MPIRRRDPVSVPRTFHKSGPVGHDYGIEESISRAGFFSNSVLEDTDLAAARSRGRDNDLLRSTQSAIIDTEMHSSPRAAVASHRARASSVPPRTITRPARFQQQLNNNRPRVVLARPQSAIYEGPLYSGGLHASRPPLPKLTDRKAIRTVDGFTKPKNVMSWEHRCQSRLSPEDLIETPTNSFGRMRAQVQSTREKMDRHKQLLDRYLDPEKKLPSAYTGNNNNAGGDPETAPMSDLRRRIRRTLAKTRNSP